MAYKLLLVQDVDELGKKGEVVKVKSGYARNFLLPQGFAVVADPHTLRTQAKLQDERAKQAVVDKQEAEALKSKMDGVSITIPVKVDQEGHMYGSVTAQDVAAELHKATGIELEKKAVQLRQHLKVTGLHKVAVKLKEGVMAEVTLTIEPEGAEKNLGA